MEIVILLVYFVALSILFGFGIHSLALLYYYRKTQNEKVPEYDMPEVLPYVTIQLPVFNELYVVERLIRTVCEFDYPKEKMEIQVLDDSTDDTVELSRKLVEEYSAKGFDIKLLHRTDRSGYKAGALKAGLEVSKGEFVAIFDADFVPKKDFLRHTIPHFQNPNIGLVQTRWEHLNEDYSYLTKAQALALDGHFIMEQQVRSAAGFFFSFNGTAGIWRKECIIDAGNWHADTLTEDLDLSYRAQLRGWKFLFLKDVTSPAELPVDINSLKVQQFRWTKGYVETALKLLPVVMKARIPLKVKAECFIHLTSNLVFPFIILVALLNVPLVILKNTIGGFDEFYSLMSIFVLASISTFLSYTYAQKSLHIDWRRRLLLFPVFLAGSMGLAVNNTKAVFEALLGRKTEFARTPKAGIVSKEDQWEKKKYKNKKAGYMVTIELFLTGYYAIGIGISLAYLEIAAIPFQLMFFLGFGTIGFLSLRHAFAKTK